MRDESLDKVADRVLTALKSMSAYGRSRARPQREVAALAGTNTRTLQGASLVLNHRGEPVVTTCANPSGMFIAETHEELEAYDNQLSNRLRGNAMRLKPIRRIRRAWAAAEAIEPNGQRRLFA